MRRPNTQNILFAAAISLCFGLTAIAFLQGFSTSFPLRMLEGIAVFVAGAVLIFGPFIWIALRMADWRSPESEEEFEALVEQSERLARDNLAPEPGEGEFLELDPYDDAEFEELVGDALDELPDWARKALDHVAVVISDGGRERRAYGLYHGDGVARDNYPDRIIIYRDTLRRDFGHDPDELREQVVITVRHELAHHLGWDELGVRDLGL
jgi:predicted Zn-dependent protease with MMP-like domain